MIVDMAFYMALMVAVLVGAGLGPAGRVRAKNERDGEAVRRTASRLCCCAPRAAAAHRWHDVASICRFHVSLPWRSRQLHQSSRIVESRTI